MNEQDKERKDLLQSLLQLDKHPAELARRLEPFDSEPGDDAIVMLTAAHASAILQRYLDGELDRYRVESWARLLQSRMDIGFEPLPQNVLADFVFELAHPIANGPLTEERARFWVQQLYFLH